MAICYFKQCTVRQVFHTRSPTIAHEIHCGSNYLLSPVSIFHIRQNTQKCSMAIKLKARHQLLSNAIEITLNKEHKMVYW